MFALNGCRDCWSFVICILSKRNASTCKIQRAQPSDNRRNITCSFNSLCPRPRLQSYVVCRARYAMQFLFFFFALSLWAAFTLVLVFIEWTVCCYSIEKENARLCCLWASVSRWHPPWNTRGDKSKIVEDNWKQMQKGINRPISILHLEKSRGKQRTARPRLSLTLLQVRTPYGSANAPVEKDLLYDVRSISTLTTALSLSMPESKKEAVWIVLIFLWFSIFDIRLLAAATPCIGAEENGF